MTGAQFALYLFPVSGPVSLLEVVLCCVLVLCREGDEVAVVCNPIRMVRAHGRVCLPFGRGDERG